MSQGADHARPPLEAVRRPGTPAQAKALSHPLRLRILREALDEARTNAELADTLGRDPGTVLHHVRVLEAEGFLEREPERTGARGAREVPYRATGLSWLLDFDPAHRQAGIASAVLEASMEELVAAGPDALIADGRMALTLSAEARSDFVRDLAGLLDSYRGREAPDGDRVAFFWALHHRH